MRLNDIPRVPVHSHMPREVQELQKNAHRYIKLIIEKTRAFPQIKSLAELPQGALRQLAGGNASALYSLELENELIVIKLRRDGIESEYETLAAWAAQGVRVPAVRRKGVTPESAKLQQVKYLLLDFIVDKKGEQAPTGTHYLGKNPRRARRVGQLLGRTLARMHRAKSRRTFGEFADTAATGSAAPLKSWNRYLLGYIRLHRNYLIRLGISRRLLTEFVHTIERTRFPKRGAYLHGDYSLRNVMIESANPLKIAVFDPNPLIGDPSWDIATLFNNRDYRRKRYEWEPTNQDYRSVYRREERFFEGFWRSYKLASQTKIDLHKIRISQLILSILQLQTEENKRYRSKTDKELEIRVRREALFERFGSFVLSD